jgi:MFS transporter, DHA2 family, metal-tetracycline-proton antiporter
LNSDPQAYKGKILMRLLLFTVMISSMSAMMFNVVLPAISEEFRLTLAEVSWLSSAYTIIYAFGTVTYGKLADRYQLKSLLTFGLSVFAAGSLVGLLSETFWMALFGRCLQSAGAAAIPAIALIIPVRYFPPERRGSALSTTAIGLALGGAIAPILSAIIVSFVNWRWLFLPSLLILLLVPLYRRYLEHEPKGAARSFDWLGGGLLAASIAMLLLGITNRSLWPLIAAAVSFILFLARIRRANEPFIEPLLLRSRSYIAAVLLAFMISGIGVSLFFLTPILLADIYRMEPAFIGYAMVPAAIVSSLLGRLGGRLADRKGNAYLFTIASLSIMACLACLSLFTGVSPIWVAFFLIFGYAGQSYMQIAMAKAVSTALPKEQVGVGMGLFSMIGFIGQGIAVGIYGIAAEQRTLVSWNPLHGDPGSALFSNIYLILAAMHAGILLFYCLRMRTKTPIARAEHAPPSGRA